MKCPNCNRPQSNDDWCADCLKKPVCVAMKDLAEKGRVRDSGRRRRGLTVWVATDEGCTEFYRDQDRLN
jgi:hypothetical protein